MKYDRDFENFVLKSLVNFDVDEDILKLFLEETGNAKLSQNTKEL